MRTWTLMCFALGIAVIGKGQKPNWQNLDIRKDSVFGISTELAYAKLLRGKIAREIVVAVIDMGIDTSHEDLRSALWTNHGEIPGNGIDDDHSGYIDDVHGWSFLDLLNGKQDVALLAMNGKPFYDSLAYTSIPPAYRTAYQKNRRAVKENREERDRLNRILMDLTINASVLNAILTKIGKTEPSLADFQNYHANDPEKGVYELVMRALPYYKDFLEYKTKNVDEPMRVLRYQLEHGLNIEDSVGVHDDDNGNNDLMGPFLLLPESSSYHGTSVAGIIAADRNNGIGIKGVADHVKIMPLRVVTFFQELRDMKLAEAIRYAVNNGAKIINISFGNSTSYRKDLVDDAVKYAMSKDVLVIKSAGNDGLDLDKTDSYPNNKYEDGSGNANAWITVGASGWHDDSTLVPAFSNYGRLTVDVFAPGDHLTSCYPGSKYGDATGTSIAAPLVAGLAALIMEYYPHFSAIQVKGIIMRSVVKRPVLAEKCGSGGIVNAYNALELAAHYR